MLKHLLQATHQMHAMQPEVPGLVLKLIALLGEQLLCLPHDGCPCLVDRFGKAVESLDEEISEFGRGNGILVGYHFAYRFVGGVADTCKDRYRKPRDGSG